MDTKNVVVLVGRLVAEPELRYMPNGTPVANFAIAVNRSTRKPDGNFEDSLDGFFDCEIFGAQALALAENTGKGTEVNLTGSLLQKKFQSKGPQSRTISKIEIRVSSVAPVLQVPKESSNGTAPVPQVAPQPA
ncbi:MAG: single-stranded DNA-binding protein [Rubrobacter sp.]|nr:single-stranded DNA-binding protein [Rubrobacter sp.]